MALFLITGIRLQLWHIAAIGLPALWWYKVSWRGATSIVHLSHRSTFLAEFAYR
jgi:hypothetical protein